MTGIALVLAVGVAALGVLETHAPSHPAGDRPAAAAPPATGTGKTSARPLAPTPQPQRAAPAPTEAPAVTTFGRAHQVLLPIAPRRREDARRPPPRTLALSGECTISWDGGAGTLSWHDAANWSGDRLPELADSVCIGADTPGQAVFFDSGLSTIGNLESEKPLNVFSGTLRVQGAGVVDSLALAGGTLEANGLGSFDIGVLVQTGGVLAGVGPGIVVTERFQWAGGTQRGPGATLSNGAAELAGDEKTLEGRALTVAGGGAEWTAGELVLADAASLLVSEGALVAIEPAEVLRLSGAGSVVNRGAVEVRRSGDVIYEVEFDVPFANEGVVQLSEATLLTLRGSGSHQGGFSVHSRASLDFAGGEHELLKPVNVAPASGHLLVQGQARARFADVVAVESILVGDEGEATFDAETTATRLTVRGGKALVNVPLAVQTLDQSGGELAGSGELTVSENFEWTGGAQRGPGSTVSEAALGLGLSGGVKTLEGRALTVAGGGALWTAGDLVLAGGATVVNSGEFRIAPSELLRLTGSGAFTSAGTIVIDGAAAASIRTPFDNDGVVDIVAGELALGRSGTHAGTWFIGSDKAEGTLKFAGGTNELAASVIGTRSGDLVVQGNADVVLGGNAFVRNVEVLNGEATFAGDTSANELTVHDGRVTFSAAAPALAHFVTQTGGAVAIEKDAALTVEASIYELSGGALELDGNLDVTAFGLEIGRNGSLGGAGSVQGDVTNSGQIGIPGRRDSVVIAGDYTQTSDGVLDVDARRTKSGYEVDRLDVTSSATLAGTVDLDGPSGIAPPEGGVAVVAAGARLGEFEHVRRMPCSRVDYAGSNVLVVRAPCHEVLSSPFWHTVWPEIEVSGDNVVVAWLGRFGGVVVRRGVGGNDFDPMDVLTQGTGLAGIPALDAAGSTVCVGWPETSEHRHDIYLASSRDGGVSFDVRRAGMIERTSASGVPEPLVAAAGEDCYVAWKGNPREQDGEESVGWAISWSVNGSKPTLIPGDFDNGEKHLGDFAIASAGSSVYLGWLEGPLSQARVVVLTIRERQPVAVVTVGEGARNRPWPDLQLAASQTRSGENVYAVWRRAKGDGDELVAAASTDDAWGSPFVLADGSVAPFFALTASGETAHVAWEREGLWTATIAGGGIRYATRLAAEGSEPAIAAEGNEIVIGARGAFDGGEGDLFVYRSSDAGATFQGENVSANPGLSGGFFLLDRNHDIAVNGLGVFAVWGDSERWWLGDQIGTEKPEIYFASRPAGPPDVAVVEIAPVQGIFDASALVAGKETTLRVVVRDSLRDQPTEATLELAYDTEAGRVTKLVDVVLGAGENVYYLPGDSDGGTFKPGGPVFAAEVKLQLPAGLEDVNAENNVQSSTTPVKETKRLNILFVPVRAAGETLPTCAQVRTLAAASEAYIHATYPVAPAKAEMDVECASPITVGPERLGSIDRDLLFAELDMLTWLNDYDKVVGVTRDGFFRDWTLDHQGAIALAPYDSFSDSLLVERQATGGWATAHELSHQMGWVAEGHPLADSARGMTYEGAEAHASDLPASGYWVTKRERIRDKIDWIHPTSAGAAVTDPTGRWVSNATYEYLFQKLKTNPVDPPVLALRGTVSRDGSLEAAPWYAIESFLDTALGDSGEFGVRYLDAAGNLLAESAFDVSFRRTVSGEVHGAVDVDTAAFSVRVPHVAGTEKLAITRGDDTLYTRTRTPNAPSVRVTSPNGGEALRTGATAELAWEASDADGDALSFIVALSLDGGKSWRPLAADVREQRLAIDLRLAHLTDSALVRVIATDGWNSSEDRSDAAFSIVPTSVNGKIAFSRDTGNNPANRLFVMNADGTGELELPAGPGCCIQPAWSPDGTRLAFTKEGGEGGLYVMNADGTQRRRIAFGGSPDWSPDGKKIAFDGGSRLFVINSDGTGLTQLGAGLNPDWFPDGSKLVFNTLHTSVGEVGSVGELWTVNADGTERQRLIGNRSKGEAVYWDPAVSPEGDEIAFFGAGFGRVGLFCPNTYCLYVSSADGTTIRRLTQEGIIGGSVDWAPDGTKLVFHLSRQIWVVNPDGSGLTRLTGGFPAAANPSWQAVGRSEDEPPSVPEPPRGGKAEAGGPYESVEGDLVPLDASRSSHPDGSIPLYEWDLDGDGSYEAFGLVYEALFADSGSFTVGLRVTDAAGQATDTATVNVANVAPTVDAGPDQSADDGVGRVALASATYTDPGGLDEHTATIDWGDGATTAGEVEGAGTFGNLSGSHRYRDSGTYTVTVRVCDDDGGCGSDSFSADVLVDVEAPVTTAAISPEPNAAGWSRSDVTVTLTAKDDISGVKEIVYQATGAQPLAQTASARDSVSIPITAEGETTITFFAVDKVGNEEDPEALVIRLDKTAPSIRASRAPEPNAHGWNRTDVSVSFACADGLSGLASCSEAVTVTTEAKGQSVTGTAVDVAGNTTQATVGEINIDKTVPLVTASRSPAANAHGWNNTDVTARFEATDALSGIDGEGSVEVVFAEEGRDQSATRAFVDRAGNAAEATVSGISIDKTAPEVTASRAPAANAHGWNKADVTARWTASDPLSGIDGEAAAEHVFGSEGVNQSAIRVFFDRAGNDASAAVAGVNIDKTAPVVTASRSPAPNAHGWNNTDVTARFEATDALSGIDGEPGFERVFREEGASQSVARTFSDRAGNEATGSVRDVSIDKTAPSIAGSRTPAANEHGWNNVDVTASFACADALSGIASCTEPVTLTNEGADQSVAGRAEDRAGNAAQATVAGISIDKTAPQITGFRTPGPNAFGWNNTDVTVFFDCSDALAGIDTCGPTPQVVSAEGFGQARTATAVDRADNRASATVGLINIDKTPPALSCAATPDSLWPPNHRLVPIELSVDLSDSLSGPLGFWLASATSDEPDAGPGLFSNDIQGFAAGTADTAGELRAERLGTGDGRLYTLTYSGIDRAFNAALCGATVAVPHDLGGSARLGGR